MIFFNIMLPLLIFTKLYSEPTRQFYVAVSPTYSLFMIFTVSFLPFEKLGYWALISVTKRIKRRNSVIQREYEDALRRKEFDFTHNMPYLLGLLTIVFFFVGGMPFLILIFAVYALMYFWIEKVMVLKFYRKPKYLEGTAMRFADYIVVGILIMHIFVSIIMYATDEVFPQDTKYVEGIRRGYFTNYYEPKRINFFKKFGVVTN